MTARSGLPRVLAVGSLFLLAGCSDSALTGPPRYVETASLTQDLKDPNRADLHGNPERQQEVRQSLRRLFGTVPNRIVVPAGSGLREGGRYLGNYVQVGEGANRKVLPIRIPAPEGSGTVAIAGGYGLYRRHCLHCHGASGAGDGPTAPFLYPRPRDYRRGIYKFTSTPSGAKPTRDDLRKTITSGLHGTSMPAFESLMSRADTEQVIDYVMFLSMRGETEQALIDEASASGELTPEAANDVAKSVFNKWKVAEAQVVNPPIPRPPSTPASVFRGKELFLSVNPTGNKVDCTSCHGPQAVGDGPSFVAQEVFNDVVFGGDPSLQDERLAKYEESIRTLWKNSLDDWGNPLRPANLNRGVYKGGRRPLDLYWRIAKGINGVKMPAHSTTIEPERIWDLVNFILALPYEPRLLEGATLPAAPPATAPKVARR